MRSTTPALADMDGDNKLEIIITSYFRDSPYSGAKLHVLRYNGSQFEYLPGFPLDLVYGGDSAPVVGDLNNDGFNEIVCIAGGRIADSTVASIQVVDKTGSRWTDELSNLPIPLQEQLRPCTIWMQMEIWKLS